jgi:hypothetical protein
VGVGVGEDLDLGADEDLDLGVGVDLGADEDLDLGVGVDLGLDAGEDLDLGAGAVLDLGVVLGLGLGVVVDLDWVAGLVLDSVVGSVVGLVVCSANRQWLHSWHFRTESGLWLFEGLQRFPWKEKIKLTGFQSSFCQRSTRLAPPHDWLSSPEQADVHSPGVETGICVKLLAQRQSRPYSTAKYLYGAWGVVGVFSVQNLLVCEHVSTSTQTGWFAYALQLS